MSLLVFSFSPRSQKEGIRMRELDPGFKVTGLAFMVGELAAIIICDGMHPISARCETTSDSWADGRG
jgi:hypothetical protein